MANVDSPFGLKPVGHIHGSSYNPSIKRCYLATGESNALYIGDAVQLAGSADTKGSAPTVTKATAGDGNFIYGVIVAFEFDPDNLTRQYRVASTARYCFVNIDPGTIYQIQDDGAATTDADYVGLNAVLIFTHGGSTVTGLSGMELDTNSDAPATDASNQLLIMGLSNIENNALGAHAIWDVLINLHTLKATGDGDGSLGV